MSFRAIARVWNARDEALSQLAGDDAMRDAGQTVMRTDVTPEEHALLLTARALKDAKQAYADANNAMSLARDAMNNAGEASVSAQRSYDNALAALTAPAQNTTGEADCS